MAGRASKSSTGITRCPSCSAPLLVQWVGDVAAIKARVTLPPEGEPRPYGPAAAASTPDSLVWCLPRQRFRPLRLRWTGRSHPHGCPHQHLLDHTCTAEPTTLF